MPLTYRILLSLIVLLVATLVAWSEFSGASPMLGWVVVAIASVMLLGLWVFPEAGGGKPDDPPRR